MNNPFEYTPSAECDAAFQRLVALIDDMRRSGRENDAAVCREFDAGKMLGVLVAEDAQGRRHTLFAFSGQLGAGGFRLEGFVEPVFDYLRPDGYFKCREREISRLNADIDSLENGGLAAARAGYELAKEELYAPVTAFREKCKEAKEERKRRRETGLADAEELAAMVRRSQFEKAELHRRKKRAEAALAPSADVLARVQARLAAMKERRRRDSEALQQWLFSNFRLLNAHGEERSLSRIFADTTMGVPPSGAGECCAPKLLQSAYVRGWRPVSIAEYWYGAPKGGEVRIHGRHYPACCGKCGPVLRWMLQGLDVEPPLDAGRDGAPGGARDGSRGVPEVIFECRWFCVVDKPSGMLSVPGRGKELSVQQWLEEKYGTERGVRMAHRLDQDTSGLLIATFGEESYRTMQRLFATRQVKKEYVAELEGDYREKGVRRQGRIELPLIADWLDRPRQRVDLEEGKPAVTLYQFTEVAGGRSRVLFSPATGRTHQLRVHSAAAEGLGMPIAGDRLYGSADGGGAKRLMLHARRLEFTFPLDGKSYTFESPEPFGWS